MNQIFQQLDKIIKSNNYQERQISSKEEEKKKKYILNNPICEIEKMDNQILINQIQITTDDQNYFKKQLNQVIKQIDTKLLQDRQQLLDEYEKLKQEYQSDEQIQNNDILYFYLEFIKKKYEQILIELSNSELSQFKLDFISPFHLKYDIQSSLFINSEIKIKIPMCGKSNCNLFYDKIKHLINNEVKQLLIFNTLQIDLDLSNKNCKDNLHGKEKTKRFCMHTNIDFKEVILNKNTDSALCLNQVYFDFEVKPSVKKLIIYRFSDIILNVFDLETSGLLYGLQLLKNIHEQQTEIGEIKIRQTTVSYSSQSIDILQQLFQCKYLIYLVPMSTLLKRMISKKINIFDQETQIQQSKTSRICNDDSQQDICLYKRLYQDNDINVLERNHIGIFDKSIQNFPLIKNEFNDEFSLYRQGKERKQRLLDIYRQVSKKAYGVVNKRYSISLSCITTYKLFHTHFSVFRILYDLHEFD